MAENRTLATKATFALVFALLASRVIGMVFPHARPFVDGFGHQFIPHAPDNSFPSDHGTGIFTFALAFLFWYRRIWLGALLIVWGRHCVVPCLSWRTLAARHGRRAFSWPNELCCHSAIMGRDRTRHSESSIPSLSV